MNTESILRKHSLETLYRKYNAALNSAAGAPNKLIQKNAYKHAVTIKKIIDEKQS